MDKEIKDLLENEVLGEDVKTALQEAFNNKVKLMEQKLQEDYAKRYQTDNKRLVEAMDKMLSDSIRAELTEFAEDRSALIRQRAKMSNAVLEAKKVYSTKMNEHAKMLNSFVAKQLKAELVEFANDRKNLQKQRREMANELQSIRETSERELAKRVNKLEGFVLKQLSEEINEFQTDKKALIEQRVKLAEQGKKKLNEVQNKFINRATAAVDKTLNEVIKTELVQWRDDIKVARENNFGRRIFEAVASEYMVSYLSEGSEVKKLTKKLKEQAAALEKTNAKLIEQKTLSESIASKFRAVNDRLERNETLKELLAPLARDKKAIMEDMLKDVKTSQLKESFARYLPIVVSNNNSIVNNSNNNRTLIENKKTNSVAVTGDRQSNINNNTKVVLDDSQSDEMGQLLRLAGINK